MKAKYILWTKGPYAAYFTPDEFDTKEEMANAVLRESSKGGTCVMTRRMGITSGDSAEAEIVGEEVLLASGKVTL